VGANDDDEHPWLAAERRFIANAVENGKLVPGICLGAQLLAAALGGRVFRNPEREIGWHPVALTDAGRVVGLQFHLEWNENTLVRLVEACKDELVPGPRRPCSSVCSTTWRRWRDHRCHRPTEDRNFVKKAVNWALRQIGKRNGDLNAAAVAVAERLRQSDSKAARWVASAGRGAMRNAAPLPKPATEGCPRFAPPRRKRFSPQ
jgi:putative intracellular protease/amidase